MDFSTVHVVVATPCYGGLLTQRYVHSTFSLIQVATAAGFRVSLELLGYDSLIPRSRNALVARFLDMPTATHLFFIDADIGFGVEQVIRMIKFDQDVVAGMYPLKLRDWTTAPLIHLKTGEKAETASLRYVGTPCQGREFQQRTGFVTGLYAGAGFLLIKRAVLTKMISAYPHLRFTAMHTQAVPNNSPHQYALFDCMIEPDTGHYLSEDYTFCRRWRDIGGTLWLDTQGPLIHVGAHEFAGRPDVRDFAHAAGSYTPAA